MNFFKKTLFGAALGVASANIFASQATETATTNILLFFLSALKIILLSNFPLLIGLIIMLRQTFKTKANRYILPVGIATSLSFILMEKTITFAKQGATHLFPNLLAIIKTNINYVSVFHLVQLALSVALLTLIQTIFLKFIFRKEESFSIRSLILFSTGSVLLRIILRLSLMLMFPNFMLLAKYYVLINLPWGAIILFSVQILYIYMLGTFIYWLAKDINKNQA